MRSFVGSPSVVSRHWDSMTSISCLKVFTAFSRCHSSSRTQILKVICCQSTMTKTLPLRCHLLSPFFDCISNRKVVYDITWTNYLIIIIINNVLIKVTLSCQRHCRGTMWHDIHVFRQAKVQPNVKSFSSLDSVINESQRSLSDSRDQSSV